MAVAPGYVGTAMVKGMNQKALDYIIGQVPIGRLIEPEEVAASVAYLASDEARFITGIGLPIDGAQTAG